MHNSNRLGLFLWYKVQGFIAAVNKKHLLSQHGIVSKDGAGYAACPLLAALKCTKQAAQG
jgi:hypothetical protein